MLVDVVSGGTVDDGAVTGAESGTVAGAGVVDSVAAAPAEHPAINAQTTMALRPANMLTSLPRGIYR